MLEGRKGNRQEKDCLHEDSQEENVSSVPGGKKNHSVNSVKQNTHIRFNSYLTKLYLIFILARFALVLIPAIQISISGTYCYSRLYIRKKVSSLLSNLQILTKSHSSFSPNIQLATHIIPLPPIQVDFIIWGIQDPFNLSI